MKFASQSQAKVMNLCIALANTKKNQLSTPKFLKKMQGIADELVAVGYPITHKELISFILAGIGAGYSSLVALVGVVTPPMTLSWLYAHIHAYDQRQLMLHGEYNRNEFETSANDASRQQCPCYNNYRP
jgi:hypothetical protein